MPYSDGLATDGGRLRSRIAAKHDPLLVPGAANAITALLAEKAGFEAVYVTGAGIANAYLGLPDLGMVSLPELSAHVSAMSDVISIPLVVDADTGFGDAIATYRTVRILERCGANAIQLEDQATPKRCGHFENKRLISTREMVGKISAALDARVHEETLIIARTDAAGVEGFDRAVERAATYQQAGVDIIFVEAPTTVDQLAALPSLIAGPQMVNIVEGGLTPQLPLDELSRLGFAIVLYANSALRAATQAVQRVLGELKSSGSTAAVLEELTTWDERQDLVRKPHLDAMADKYAATAQELEARLDSPGRAIASINAESDTGE